MSKRVKLIEKDTSVGIKTIVKKTGGYLDGDIYMIFKTVDGDYNLVSLNDGELWYESNASLEAIQDLVLQGSFQVIHKPQITIEEGI